MPGSPKVKAKIKRFLVLNMTWHRDLEGQTGEILEREPGYEAVSGQVTRPILTLLQTGYTWYAEGDQHASMEKNY